MNGRSLWKAANGGDSPMKHRCSEERDAIDRRPMPVRPLLALPFALAALALLPAAAPQSSVGASLFKQRCQSCHSVTAGAPSPLAPNLKGIVGRKAGATTFRYSPALKAANITWTKPNLDKFLAGPGKMVPGTRMVISVPDAKQRAELVNYLASIK